MRRFTAFHRRVAAGLALVVLLVFAAQAVPSAADAVCPKCGAPLEPGALFCGRCGAKLEAPAPQQAGAPDRRGAVVQVVAAYDTELTSTYGSLAYEANMRVDSILGSAFAVAPGEFVTDNGLLVGAKSVSLRIPSGRSVPASLVGSDPMIGVALLKADLSEVAVLNLRAEEPPRMGETLEALGFPSGAQASRDPVVSAGVVSGLHRGPVGIRPIEDYLQTDASLPRGLAGGPMLDSSGRVVGMSTAWVFGSQVSLGPQSGIGYAVPAEWIGRALSWIRSGATPRAWMGAHAIPVDSEVRERFKLPSNVRLVVDQVFPDSPAAAAGLKRGDGLLKVQGEEAANLTLLQQSLLPSKPGESVVVDVTRSGEAVHVAVTLAPRPDKPRLTGIDALRFFGDVDIVPAQGDRLVVASVSPGSELARLKVAPGDILQSVLSKKDWVHGAKDNSRWRSVRTVADLENRLATAYSDLDFCLGLRFKGKDGTKREHYLWAILTPTGAL